jgi:hypothetical protein
MGRDRGTLLPRDPGSAGDGPAVAPARRIVRRSRRARDCRLRPGRPRRARSGAPPTRETVDRIPVGAGVSGTGRHRRPARAVCETGLGATARADRGREPAVLGLGGAHHFLVGREDGLVARGASPDGRSDHSVARAPAGALGEAPGVRSRAAGGRALSHARGVGSPADHGHLREQAAPRPRPGHQPRVGYRELHRDASAGAHAPRCWSWRCARGTGGSRSRHGPRS